MAFAESLPSGPPLLMFSITKGHGVDHVLENLLPYFKEGDTIVRYNWLEKKGIGYVGISVSSGYQSPGCQKLWV